MSSKSTQLSSLIQDAVTMVLIVAGTALWLWGDRSDGEEFEQMVSASVVPAVVEAHNQASSKTVRGVSDMTIEEIRAAFANVQARHHAIAEAELDRIWVSALAKLGGVCCWIVGTVGFVLRWSRRQGRIAQLPVLGEREKRSLSAA